ncbi:MAG: UDP-N-acetylglucosamine 2-epimerase (non-hydrolyzing) [Actinobacteria bacterium]|nr:UDP-N-acetylglucosamine 2-epimerase (non-hydrolyzing) [Actinomycetota bacterium]
MNPLKFLFIFGTRPEAIKIAPVIQLAKGMDGEIKTTTVVTAQHRDMLDQVLSVFDIEPDYDLNIMRTNQTLSDITRRSVARLDEIIKTESPDVILVQGDTTTAFVGALVGYYNRIKVAHIEAGLRSFDKFNPFPEEINRRLISIVSDFHFAPTKSARENLISEGISLASIRITGNTVVDALKIAVQAPQVTNQAFSEDMSWFSSIHKKKAILLTTHRRENIGEPMVDIFTAVRSIANVRDDVVFIFPVHKNPVIQKLAKENLKGIQNVILSRSLSYFEMVYVLKNCYLVLTDSGGLQEEAPTFGKPVLVLREVTERPEGVKFGCAKVVGTDSDNLKNEINNLLDDGKIYASMSNATNPYGDGNAAKRIIGALLYNFGLIKNPPDEFRPKPEKVFL